MLKLTLLKEMRMKSMMLSLWDDFRKLVSVDMSQTTYIIIVCVLGICGMLALLSFFKGNYNKGKSVKWGKIVVAVLMFGILALLSAVRFA